MISLNFALSLSLSLIFLSSSTVRINHLADSAFLATKKSYQRGVANSFVPGENWGIRCGGKRRVVREVNNIFVFNAEKDNCLVLSEK